jgi:hypothetical protein
MSYLAKLLLVYRERERTEADSGFVTAGTHYGIREIAGLLIGAEL